MKTSEKMEKIEEYLAGEKIDPAWRDMILEYKAYLSRQVHHTTDAEKEYIERGEVVEVRHGEWTVFNDAIHGKVDIARRFAHKECGCITPFMSKYCPHCGARMDGGKHETD